jgi:hypothetical protein
MRKYLAAGAVCAVALGVAGTAQAGVEATDANGNFIVLDADYNPPATHSATGLTVDLSFGNKRSGGPFPQTQTFDFAGPRGGVYNGKLFPKCALPTSQQDIATDRCAKNTQIGTGGAVIDARNLGVQEPVVATLTVYNGALRQGKPTQVILAKATVGGQPINSEIDLVYAGGRFSEFNDAQGTSTIPYSFSSFNLAEAAVLKTKIRGKTALVSLLGTPRSCPSKGWVFTFTHTDTNGNKIAAADRQPCVKVRG